MGIPLFDFIRKWASPSVIWGSIEEELLFARDAGLLKGVVLNAGAGVRDISHLIDGHLVNQDIRWENDTRKHIHIFGSLSEIPEPNDTFDCIICIAVLEHVRDPTRVVSEFFRVTKPGGYVIASPSYS
jgi:SAM-dependent methyltransferase